MKCPQHPVLAHLQRHVRLSASDRNAIEALFQSCRKVKSGRELIRSGAAGKTFAVVEGWIARESLLLDGRQQITALFLPGDVFDLNAELIADCDYSLRAVTDSTVVEISRSQLRRLKDQPRLDEALCWEELEQLAISTEWLVNLGQRSASERIAHLLCEIYLRLRSVGMARDGWCDMPLTQSMIAEVTGLTRVHVSRSLQRLRSEELIHLERGRLRIPDLVRLEEFGLFEANYLHLT
jgi:CRP-like cAMP-binding protein